MSSFEISTSNSETKPAKMRYGKILFCFIFLHSEANTLVQPTTDMGRQTGVKVHQLRAALEKLVKNTKLMSKSLECLVMRGGKKHENISCVSTNVMRVEHHHKNLHLSEKLSAHVTNLKKIHNFIASNAPALLPVEYRRRILVDLDNGDAVLLDIKCRTNHPVRTGGETVVEIAPSKCVGAENEVEVRKVLWVVYKHLHKTSREVLRSLHTKKSPKCLR